MVNGSRSTHFKNKKDTASATLTDLQIMLDKLSTHYGKGSGRLERHDEEILVNIFSTMADYYKYGSGGQIEEDEELYEIYDTLAGVFGQASDFIMSDIEINDMHETIQADGNINVDLEGNLYSNIKDLIDKNEKNESYQMQQLLNQL